MVSTVLAGVLQSYLGQYLELSDTSISVGSEVRLNNVKLKESALSDLGLPVKCVHGKVSRLVIKIPWFHLFTSKTTIELDGLHLLIVPSTAVKFDEWKEIELANEAKQKRLERTENARNINMNSNKGGGEQKKESDTFVERLVANIIKNLEVTVNKVHLRYEDSQKGGSNYPFAAGITLDSVSMNTEGQGQDDSSSIKLKIFEKHVVLNSLALYWRPRANLYSADENAINDHEKIYGLFDSAIGTKSEPVNKLKYLLGPISSTASMQWCPNPQLFDYAKPEVDLNIAMDELSVSMTKYQYQDLMILLQSFEYLSRASRFRKYKARHGLEGLPNYLGKWKELWKFAFDSIHEEEVMRRINNWSWSHMKEHLDLCKAYRKAYIDKLNGKGDKKRLRRLEDELDEVNIQIQRQLAERDVDLSKKRAEAAAAAKGGGFWGWWSGGTSPKASESAIGSNIKKLEAALTHDEKSKLYEVIDYQENAHHGIYPKDFEAKNLAFNLKCLTLRIRDDDLNNADVIKLELREVAARMIQRPSADYLKFGMTMADLTVTGFKKAVVAVTRNNPLKRNKHLLSFTFENNPPSDEDFVEQSSVYDQRIRFYSSPLEITYDSRTLSKLLEVFKAPDDLNLANLQQSASSKLKEYRKTTSLGLQYVIDNHNLIDVDVNLESSYIIVPHKGKMLNGAAAAVVNLGSIAVKSKPISMETRSLKELSLSDITEAFKKNLRDQAYDKFTVTLDNMQVIVSLPNEDWRAHLERETSPLFLLKPTSLTVNMAFCLIKNDPDMPVSKISGNLDNITVNISDYRLNKLAQILDSLVDVEPDEDEAAGGNLHRTDSEASMKSALSSLANTGSMIQTTLSASVSSLAPDIGKSGKNPLDEKRRVPPELVQMTANFKIGRVDLSLNQMGKTGERDERLFHFVLLSMEAEAKLRPFDLTGDFKIGGVDCEHSTLKTPDGEKVKILGSADAANSTMLTMTYTDVKKSSPKYDNVLKKLEVNLKSVKVNCHQDAILDVIDKVNKFIDEVKSNAKHLLAEDPNESLGRMASVNEDEEVKHQQHPSKPPLKKQTSWSHRRLSMKTPANLSRWAFRAKKSLSMMEEKEEEVEMRITAKLDGVEARFMTSKVDFADLRVRDLHAEFFQTKTRKVIKAKLIDFRIHDPVKGSLYSKIAESLDEKVFDAKVTLFDNVTKEKKAASANVVDVHVQAEMGRIKLVFLMKFVQDFLTFLEPFSGAKEAVVETANLAFDKGAKSMIDAYAKATRAKLDIKMVAPVIIIPVDSESVNTFIADLGTFTLSNAFMMDAHGRVFDDMKFSLENLQLSRAKIAAEATDNAILASALIVQPISMEIDIRRNMNGAMKRTDPAEIAISGTLYEIDVDLSKSDYGIMMNILTRNFSEKGSFDKNKQDLEAKDKSLHLPLKKRRYQSGSSMSSNTAEQHAAAFQEALKAKDRDQEAKAVEFNFRFLGFKADLYTGETALIELNEVRDVQAALARVHVRVIGVDGHLLVGGNIRAKAYLENMILEDIRDHSLDLIDASSDLGDGERIKHLMEAKVKSESPRMIDIDYNKDPVSNEQKVEIIIYSFVLVVSMDYLLELANFFVQEQEQQEEEKHKPQHGGKHQPPQAVEVPDTAVEAEEDSKMSVYIKIEEPDLFLVENIGDTNSDALMLNTELQFKFWSSSLDASQSMMASLCNFRCHTCRFNPKNREQTLAQILQPTTVSFTLSKNSGHGMRINLNLSDFCLNVSPHSISVITRALSAFVESMSKPSREATLDNRTGGTGRRMTAVDIDHTDLWKIRRYEYDEFWYLKPDETSVEALEDMTSYDFTSPRSRQPDEDEQAIIKIGNLVVKIESGLGNNTIPLLLMESSLSCDARNWSSGRMTALGNMSIEVAYYNSKLALWEPVIEPVTQMKPDGGEVNKRWDLSLGLQCNAPEDMYGSAFTSPNIEEPDGFVKAELMPPLMSLTLESREILEVTVTKSFVSVLQTLGESFANLTDQRLQKSLPVAPFVVQNFTGKKITILLDSRSFKYFEKNDSPGRVAQLELNSGEDKCLFLFKDRNVNDDNQGQYVSPLREQTEHEEASLRIRIHGERGVFDLPVSKADRRFFPFPFR